MKMQMQYIFVLLGFVIVAIWPELAFAQDFNQISRNITNSGALLPALASAFAYLSGMMIGVWGILKTIEHVNNPQQTPLRVPVVRFVVGGALFSLPIVLEAASHAINGGSMSAFDPGTNLATTFTGAFAALNALTALGSDVNTLILNMGRSIDEVPALVSAVGYLLGIVIALSALYKIRDHVDDPDRVPIREAVVRLLTAGALFSLPTVFSAMYTTIAGGGMGTWGTISSIWGTAMFFYSTETSSFLDCSPVGLGAVGALATFLGLGSAPGLDNVVCNMMRSFSAMPGFVTGLAYLLGVIMGLWGILKIRDHALNPSQTPLWEGVSRLIAGGAFFAFPLVVMAFKDATLPIALQAWGGVVTNTGFQSDITASSCGTANSLDLAMACFMGSMLGPSHVLLNFVAYVAGLIFIMIGISRLIKSSQEGARGPGGVGTIGTFIVGGLLLSATTVLRAVSSGMFGSPVTFTEATLSYATGMSVAETQAVYNVINAVLRFMIIIGMVSFVRGIFIMRDVAEGNQGASTMVGMTHIIGGVMAVNLGPLLNAVQVTLGITSFGIMFG